MLASSSRPCSSTDVLMGGYWSKKEEDGKEKGQNKKKKRGGRKGLARVLVEQAGGVVKVYGVSNVDSLLVLKRTG